MYTREEHLLVPQSVPVPSTYRGLNTATLVTQTSLNPFWVYLRWEKRTKGGIPNLNGTIKREIHLHLRIIQHSKPPTFLQVALRTQSTERDVDLFGRSITGDTTTETMDHVTRFLECCLGHLSVVIYVGCFFSDLLFLGYLHSSINSSIFNRNSKFTSFALLSRPLPVSSGGVINR